jgi:hypothetical protein
MESARINRMLEAIRCQELKQVIHKQGGSCCVPPVVNSVSIVPVESTLEKAKSDPTSCPNVTYGTSVQLESTYLNNLFSCVISTSVTSTDPDARFSQYRRPYIPPACPPIPQGILNGNLPKNLVVAPCPAQRFQGVITRKCQ